MRMPAPGESTSDMVFAGHNVVAENGRILSESLPFSKKAAVSEIDVSFLLHERSKSANFGYEKDGGYLIVPYGAEAEETQLTRAYARFPFVPERESELGERAELILTMQAEGLKRRLAHTGAKKLVIGLSGGLDSTLALLVAARAAEASGRPMSDIVGVTMPCFGTTDRTFNNTVALAKAMKITFKKIDITKSVLRHFREIGQDPAVTDVTYENAQARERTQVLMDIANMTGGLVVGTGDLSELALGWATYNGDHMSMYGVNAGVPKTLVRYLVRYEALRGKPKRRKILFDILDTPVSRSSFPRRTGRSSNGRRRSSAPMNCTTFSSTISYGWDFRPKKSTVSPCMRLPGNTVRRKFTAG